MDIVTPQKTYLVKNWTIRLKNGAMADINIREDKDESFERVGNWWVWQWPTQKRVSRIRDGEIAAFDYQELEFKELKAYKPKHKHGKTETNTDGSADAPKEA